MDGSKGSIVTSCGKCDLKVVLRDFNAVSGTDRLLDNVRDFNAVSSTDRLLDNVSAEAVSGERVDQL